MTPALERWVRACGRASSWSWDQMKWNGTRWWGDSSYQVPYNHTIPSHQSSQWYNPRLTRSESIRRYVWAPSSSMAMSVGLERVLALWDEA
ncbi:hypothetical protein RJT34_11871 [Clitoria ternatea]|uniref:Uncharacterized protein n=1 Tax=Clitoria ternatea TaxID=43366 RepID=A0AAN9JMM2_CLITE